MKSEYLVISGKKISNDLSIRIERVFAMPNRWTFQIKPIAKLLKEELTKDLWIDPFCGMTSPATITNDINPDIKADFNKDAIEFLKMHKDNSVYGILFDPPYSVRQVSECYKKYGYPVTIETTQSSWYTKIRKEISRIVKPGGKTITFGWNSIGIGKTLGFKLERILLVTHGGSHNDTIVTVERKMNGSLF